MKDANISFRCDQQGHRRPYLENSCRKPIAERAMRLLLVIMNSM